MQGVGSYDDENISGLVFDFTHSDNENALVEFMKTRRYIGDFHVLYASRMLEKFPPAFLEFQNILVLDFSNNRLQHIPLDICRLVNLKKLELQNNLLVTIPYTIGKCQNLQILDLSYNNGLHKLPPTIYDCEKLKDIFLCHTSVSKHFSSEWIHPGIMDRFRRELKAVFGYREARAATVALLALSKRKAFVFRLHKDVVRHMIAPMLYETRHLDDELWC